MTVKNQRSLLMVRRGQHCATRGHCVQEDILSRTGLLGMGEGV